MEKKTSTKPSTSNKENDSRKSTITLKDNPMKETKTTTNENHYLTSALKYYDSLYKLVSHFSKLKANPVLELEKEIVQMEVVVKSRRRELRDQLGREVLTMIKFLEKFRSKCHKNVDQYELMKNVRDIRGEEKKMQEMVKNLEVEFRKQTPEDDFIKWYNIEKEANQSCKRVSEFIEFKRKKIFVEEMNFHKNVVENFVNKSLNKFELSREQFNF